MPEHISLGELQLLIKQGVENAHRLPYWVACEVSEAKVNYSGHCYLELVEKGGDNHIPKAKVNAVIWRSTFKMLSHYFSSVTGSDIAAGLKLLVKVSVIYHELYGLSLQITDIDPSYTLGDMERQRQETIARLQQDGVFDMNRELDMPVVVQRIAVVSSANAAGYQDFMNELGVSPYRFQTVLFDAFMQGAAAEDSIIAALGQVADNYDDFDAVVIIRGGGSQSDLGAFNSYRLCCHVTQFPLPVISGIGHDKDMSVVDMVSAVSLKTPTAVAVYLKDIAVQFDVELDRMLSGITGIGANLILERREQVRRAATDMKLSIVGRLGVEAAALNTYTVNIGRGARAFIAAENVGLNNSVSGFRRGVRSAVSACAKELDLLGELVANHDPARILERGFSIVRRAGKAVDPLSIVAGDEIEIATSRNIIEANVKNIR